MRFVIYGVGAIGGTIAARLALSGFSVIGIARGAQLAAIAAAGLVIKTPRGTERADLACLADPTEIDWRDDDIVMLALQGQHTSAALERLRIAGVYRQPIVCAQNGVSNERAALRLFPNVYGMVVVIPAALHRPGEVHAFGGPRLGVLDLGRAAGGIDPTCVGIAAALEAAGFAAAADPAIMQKKYGKLAGNVVNIIEAALGPDGLTGHHYRAARQEADKVLAAAGIDVVDPLADPALPATMHRQPIEGESKPGSSSWQSLARRTGSIETDYLNGEIVLLGRLHGVPTPVNAGLCRLAQWMLHEAIAPGSVSIEQIDRYIADTASQQSVP